MDTWDKCCFSRLFALDQEYGIDIFGVLAIFTNAFTNSACGTQRMQYHGILTPKSQAFAERLAPLGGGHVGVLRRSPAANGADIMQSLHFVILLSLP